MRRACKVLVMLAVVAFIASPVFAQQNNKKKRRGKQHQRTPIKILTNQLKKANLTDEQKTKVEKIINEAKEEILKLAAEAKLQPEQRKAMAEMRKKIKEEGKKGAEARKAVIAAAKMTPKQLEAFKKLQAAMQQLRHKIAAELTPEQRKAAKIGVGRRGGRKKKNG